LEELRLGFELSEFTPAPVTTTSIQEESSMTRAIVVAQVRPALAMLGIAVLGMMQRDTT